jgi:hypothetical protein
MTKLRLTDWASLVEMVGAIGVVISLIYVGVQVRANTDEIRATNRQQLIGRAHSATTSASRNPELADAFAQLSEGKELAPAEMIQYGYFVRALVYDVQEAFLLMEEGRLDEAYCDTRAALFSTYVSQETARDIYDRDKQIGLLHERFVVWADGELNNR